MTGSAENYQINHQSTLWIFVLAVLAPVIIISFFNHPIGDDYWISAMIRNQGAGETFDFLYKKVSSRYTAVALMSVNPLVFGDYHLFKVIPVVFVLLFVCVLFGFLRMLLRPDEQSVRRNELIATASVFTALYIAVMPGIGEGLFWVSSLLGYQLAILLSLMWVRLMIGWYHHKLQTPGTLIGSAVVFILLCGTNEIFAFLGCAAVLTIAISKLKTKTRFDRLLVVHLILVLMIIAFVSSSPSIGSRYLSNAGASTASRINSLMKALAYVGYHSLKLLINPFFWAGLLVLIKQLSLLSVNKTITNYWRNNTGKVSLVCSFMIVFTQFVAVHFSGNQVAPLRITNISILFLLILMVMMILAYRVEILSRFMRISRFYVPAVMILIATGFATPNNISTATRELVSGKAFHYDAQMKNRFSILNSCNSDTCVVPRVTHLPKTIRYSAHDDLQHLNEYFRTTIVHK